MSGYSNVGGGLSQPPIGEPGWWQATDGLWYPPSMRPAMPPPPMYQGPPQYYAPQRTNGFAIASLVLALVGGCGIGSILALVFGYTARSQIDRSNGAEGGRGLATAGIIIGFIGLIGIFVLIAAVTLLGSNSTVKFSSVANSIGN